MARKKSKTKKNGELSPKRERFSREWVIDCNSTQAAIRAGYSEKSACSQGARLYRNADVYARIQELKAEINEKLGITAEKVLKELGKLGFTDLADVVEISENGIRIRREDELTKEQLGAISEVTEKTVTTGDIKTKTLKIKMHDKKGALDSIGKHLGMFPNKITGPDGGDLTIKIVSEFDQVKSEPEDEE